MGRRTWKNFELSPYIYSLWDLEKFREKPGGNTRKDMKHDLYFLAWLLNRREMREKQRESLKNIKKYVC